MKRKRKVILIVCSVSFLALFAAIAWLKASGDFYALDRSGMELSLGETVSNLFSRDSEYGVMFVSAEFPKQLNTVGISQSEALQLLRRSSPKLESVFWDDIDGVGPVGIFAELESREITIYCENEEFAFELLIDNGPDLKTQFSTESIQYLRTPVMVFPQGFDFGKWEIKRGQYLEGLKGFSSCQLPVFSDSIEGVAFYSGRVFTSPQGQYNDVIIYFDSSSKSWQVKKWNEEWLLWNWKAFVTQDAENRFEN